MHKYLISCVRKREGEKKKEMARCKESLFLVLICLFSLFLSPCVRVSAPSPLQDCAETEVDRNKCCTLCNMFFTSAIVAQSHYQGKTHAKRVRLVLGEPPSLSAVASLTSAGRIHNRLTSYRQNYGLDKRNDDGTFHPHLYLFCGGSLEKKLFLVQSTYFYPT